MAAAVVIAVKCHFQLQSLAILCTTCVCSVCNFWIEPDTAIGTPTLWKFSNALKQTVTVMFWSWVRGDELLNFQKPVAR